MKKINGLIVVCLLCFNLGQSVLAGAESIQPGDTDLISMSFFDIDIHNAVSMLSLLRRKNIVVSDKVESRVTLNMYNLPFDTALKTIAESVGLTMEESNGIYYIIPHDESNKFNLANRLDVRNYKIQYSEPDVAAEVLKKYLSHYGKITSLPNRKQIIIEDLPDYLDQVEKIIDKIDNEPKQIMIEAKILEIRLDHTETFGLDWTQVFRIKNGNGSIGTQGLDAISLGRGLIGTFSNPDITIGLDALKKRGRIRTLSTPKLLVLENHEAEVIIGQRLGYQDQISTANDITTANVEFLETGVILKVTPIVDNQGRILLEVHPEVSDGEIVNTLPNETTTEVHTKLLLEHGQSTVITGLLKNKLTESRNGIPILSSIPFIKHAFANKSFEDQHTETIVIITPHVIDRYKVPKTQQALQTIEDANNILMPRKQDLDKSLDKLRKYDIFKDPYSPFEAIQRNY